MLATVGHNSSQRVQCIFRAHGERGYTKLRNAFLQDRRISDETRGLIARLLSLPDDWEVTVQSIIASGKAGRDKVYRMIKEAEMFGYIRPDTRHRDARGTLGRQMYLVSDDPEALIARAAQELYDMEAAYQPCTGNPEVDEVVADQQVSPHTAKPDVAEPLPAKPLPENPDAYKRNIEDKINNNTPPYSPPPPVFSLESEAASQAAKPKRSRKAANAVPDQYPHDFEEFWKLYPRREGKALACRSWQRLSLPQKRKAYVALRTQLPALTAKLADPTGNFCPHPATWINQGRFDDDVEAQVNLAAVPQVVSHIPAWKAEINQRNQAIDEALKRLAAKQKAKENGEVAHA